LIALFLILMVSLVQAQTSRAPSKLEKIPMAKVGQLMSRGNEAQ